MLRAFVYTRLAVLVRHWFEIDLGDSSMEHGARVELRLLGAQSHRGTESAAQRFVIDRPVWRADLFDRLAGTPGAFEVAHHHPTFDGLEPSARAYLDTEPWAWLRAKLGDIGDVCAAGGLSPAEIADASADFADVRDAAGEIVAAAQSVAPTRCASTEQCHRWTRDVTESIGIMIARTAAPDRLDRAHLAPWTADLAAYDRPASEEAS